MRFESDKTKQELIAAWDEMTSPARFSGNDDILDLIFVSKRNGNKVKLFRRAASSREPFACVFRGKISEHNGKSVIDGIFTKSVFDYIITVLTVGLLFYIRYIIVSKGESPETINKLLAVAIAGGTLLLYNTRAAKRKHAELIFKITGKRFPIFLTKKERREVESNQSDK